MVAPARLYVDVNGTDYSSKVLSVNVQRRLSDVGDAQITVMNKAGAYKSTFSEQQRVAVSACRYAFSSVSDYFSGSSVAARWAQVNPGGAAAIEISSNKLKITSIAANWCYVESTGSLSQPCVAAVWVYPGSNSVSYPFRVRLGNSYLLGGSDGLIYHYYNSAGWSSHALNSYSANTWYLFILKQTSATSVTVYVYDVNGVLLDSDTRTIDSQASSVLALGVYAAQSSYFDSELSVSGSSTYVPEQLFEGTIDKIEYNQSPDTITLHCVDDAIELERQIDDAYGRVTATSTPSYGATEDFGAMLNNLLPSGWSYTVPDMAWHDNQTVNVNTRRLTAINELIANSGYLGFYILPMKHICIVSPSYSSAPDTWTEAVGGWTAVASTVGTSAIGVDGSNMVKCTSDGNAGTKQLYRTVAIDLEVYGFLDFYYGGSAIVSVTSEKVRLYTDTATPKYWEYTLQGNCDMATPAANEAWHCRLKLPDANGDHGWTATGSPVYTDDVVRLEYRFDDTLANPGTILYIDTTFFHAPKNTTSKYTIANPINTNRQLTKPRCYSTITILTTFGTYTFSNATLATLSGTRDYTMVDYTITTSRQTAALGYNKLARQSYNLNGEPITATLMNPGDTYNVMLGDTLTLTVANFNLSSATRILGARTDTIANGWATTVTLIAIPPNTPVAELWEITKNKRYT